MEAQIFYNTDSNLYFCAVKINGGIDFYFNADGDITEERRWTEEDLMLTARVVAVKRIKKYLEAKNAV